MKTATCSGHIFYEIENEPLPTVEDYSIILNSKDEPLAIIKTTEVNVLPMNEVSRNLLSLRVKGTERIVIGKKLMKNSSQKN